MTIKVACQCGAAFGAKDELAGRTVACPKCKQPLKIGPAPAAAPAPAPVPSGGMSDLLDEAGFDNVQGPRCPQCAKSVLPNALLCVNCGFNLQTGERVAGAVIQAKEDPSGDKAVAKMLLNTASERIANEKLEDKKTRAQGAPVWVYFVAFAGVLAFVACMLLIPRDQAFRVNGTGLMIFGDVIILIYSIRMIIVAFQEDIKYGLLYLFVPFYALYYLCTRWSKLSGFFMMILLGYLFIGIGLGMIALAPMMKMSDEREEVRLERHQPILASVVAARDERPNARVARIDLAKPAAGNLV